MIPVQATAAEGNVLLTAMYPFEKLTPRKSNTAETRVVGNPRKIRLITESEIGTGISRTPTDISESDSAPERPALASSTERFAFLGLPVEMPHI